MTCRDVADFLMDYANDDLEDQVRETFEHHLQICANCREYLALYLASVTLGRHAFDDDDAAADAAGIPEELVGAILAAKPHARPRPHLQASKK